MFGTVLHRSLKHCGGCIIVGFSGRGFSSSLCGVGPSGLLLLSFNGFSGGSCSCVYRSFSSTFCRTLLRLISELQRCEGLVLLFMGKAGRPRDAYVDFHGFYASRRFRYRIASGVSRVGVDGKRMCVTVERLSIIDLVGRDHVDKLTYNRSFNLLTCGRAPTCRIVSGKVAALDVS